jgi:hypothetical protein
MVEIGRVRVKAGNAPSEQKISAYPQRSNGRQRSNPAGKTAALSSTVDPAREFRRAGDDVVDLLGIQGAMDHQRLGDSQDRRAVPARSAP